MKLILKLLLNALAVVILSYILPGVGVDSITTAILVALVLSILNFLVKPILVILTLPITILTLGLFLLIINAIIILIAAHFISGFQVSSIWWALIFSLLLSFLQSILHSILKEDKKK
ncbi:phage holin family protein [Flagellimonas hymeniacidonis]|uniref:Phage holin family protein n=1 Tax=Flagellimonas hymeniacidonis TaxID=2603628 RepID=A0A5C8V6X8_9FLAO|nr:phage holin family protein [Flagellimonas hymeniacidonis]TXN37010.1 phage holin family protein [Flagellimonas hymeniacidonis]